MLQFISFRNPRELKIESWKYNPLAENDDDNEENCMLPQQFEEK